MKKKLNNIFGYAKGYIKNNFQDTTKNIDFSIHSDPCLPPDSCNICLLENCQYRKSPLKKQIEWNIERLTANVKHHKY
jgi:hypothetical protein